jgi:MoxR-like ATPase
VLATQNPIESEGTYPLPEAQVDRFMLKVLVDYPAHDEELTVVARSLEPMVELAPVLSLEQLKSLQRQVGGVYVDPALISWAVDIATATRRPAEYGVPAMGPYVSYGASPRGPISVVAGARALALIRGRDYVLATDMEALVRDAFRHRLVLSYQALAEEVSADQVLEEVLKAVPAPQIDLGRTAPAAA